MSSDNEIHTVVSSILLAGDHGLRMEEGAVCSVLDLVNDIGLQIDVEGARDVLSGASLCLHKRECQKIFDKAVKGCGGHAAKVNTGKRQQRRELTREEGSETRIGFRRRIGGETAVWLKYGTT